MAGWMRKKVLALCAVAGVALGRAMAQQPPDPDGAGSHEARALIERQLDAFAHDDASGAYAEAAPAIKEKFADPETFLSMVRGTYAPVYRHRSVAFGPARTSGDTIEQAVTFIDRDDRVWKALYRLTRQPDGNWLISGCALILSDEKSL